MEKKTQKAALLVMDMVVSSVGRYPQSDVTVSNISKAIIYARNNNIPVIYVALSFREGAPEISANNKIFSALRQRFTYVNREDYGKIIPSLKPAANEVIVYKKRVSAFTGSDMEVILRSQGIQHIVLTGISTSGVVLSTLREAADKDYTITVLSDCCADSDKEVHQMLISKIFPHQADVLTVNNWCK